MTNEFNLLIFAFYKLVKKETNLKLTNLDISTHHKNRTYWLMRSDILGAFAYWTVKQSPYSTPDISAALIALDKYLDKVFPVDADFAHQQLPREFSYEELSALVHEDVFEKIQEIEILNHCKISEGEAYNNRHNVYNADFDFIDLGALSRNIFYMILREIITQE